MLKTLSHFASTADMNLWIDEQKASLRQGGKINGWWIDATTFHPDIVVRGYVVGDAYWGRSSLRTSAVQYIDPSSEFVITLNTIYTLGEPKDA
jgi:hypothetical protein